MIKIIDQSMNRSKEEEALEQSPVKLAIKKISKIQNKTSSVLTQILSEINNNPFEPDSREVIIEEKTLDQKGASLKSLGSPIFGSKKQSIKEKMEQAELTQKKLKEDLK